MTLQEYTTELFNGDYNDLVWLSSMAYKSQSNSEWRKVYKRSSFFQTYKHEPNENTYRQGLQWYMTVAWVLGWKDVSEQDITSLLDNTGFLRSHHEDFLDLCFDKAMEYGQKHLMSNVDIDASEAVDKDISRF